MEIETTVKLNCGSIRVSGNIELMCLRGQERDFVCALVDLVNRFEYEKQQRDRVGVFDQQPEVETPL